MTRSRCGAALISAGVAVALASLSPAAYGARPAEDSSPSAGPSPATSPTPTVVVAPSTAAQQCVSGSIYGDRVSSGPLAVIPGASIESGVRIHNTLSQSTDGATLHLYILASTFAAGNGGPVPAPTVMWGVDGGAWNSVSLTYHPNIGDILGYWVSAEVPAPAIPANGSRVFRVWMSFNNQSLPGYYDTDFLYHAPQCGQPADSGQVLLGYEPDLAKGAAVTRSNPAASTAASILPSMTSSTGRSSPPSTAPVATPVVVDLAATPSRVDGARVGIGFVVAALLGLVAVLHLLRWRRFKRSADRV